MFGQAAVVSGTMILVFIMLAILWAVALVVIAQDADETYGTGLFWMLAVLCAPLIAIPVYWLMRIGTERSLDADIAASERLQRRKMLGQRLSGMALDLDRQLGSERDEGTVVGEGSLRLKPRFTPFRASFAPEAEAFVAALDEPPANDDEDESSDTAPVLPVAMDKQADSPSSQGCGDSNGGRSLNRRLSWRWRHQPMVASRWDCSRDGSATDAARGQTPP
jgi:hypothetical protein